MRPSPLRLLLCDGSADTRAAFRTLLSEQPQLEIVGEASDGAEAVARAVELRPDVVLIDVAMPVLDGVAATGQILELLPGTRIVALAGSEAAQSVMAVMAAGASAHCRKDAPLWELERAIAGASDPLFRLAHGLASSEVAGKSELVARELAELTGAALTAVFVATPGAEPALAGATGPDADWLAPVQRLARRALRERTLVHADDLELHELATAGSSCRDVLAAPLVADGDTLGAIVAAVAAEEPLALDRDVVSSVADLAAAAFAADRKLARSFDEARRDSLTGLGNRRAFEDRLERAVADAVEAGLPTSVAVIDLDDFKHVNDTRGHAAGDEVLRHVALALQRAVRADESVFRLGGEEFAVVVDGDGAAARLVAERIRVALARHRRGGRLPTASAGVASVPVDARTRDELMARADAALYAAKWAGKDRVLVYHSELEKRRPLPGPNRPERRPVLRSVLLVDDDPGLRALLRTTLESIDLEVDEAEHAAAAAIRIAARRPDVIVLDVRMPGIDGLEFCAQLKDDPATLDIRVVLLTGDDAAIGSTSRADAFLRKPFSPLELLEVVERLADGRRTGPAAVPRQRPQGEQTQLYANDLRRLLEIERGQRGLLEKAYRETVTALAAALELKDTATKAHSRRVHRYALELARVVQPELLDDASLEYGFLLHDVGKIGIPDRILLKPAGLTESERGLMQTHPVLGEQMLGEVELLRGEGLRVVRSHHERWDGRGYPDGLAGGAIPAGARIFAVADALDAMTTDRPYRPALDWHLALDQIESERAHQFDPAVVDALTHIAPSLRALRAELAAA